MSTEVYDPATGSFRQGGDLAVGRSAHSATLLPDGRTLLVGGTAGRGTVLASAELYDPVTGRATLTGALAAVRYKHAAVLLAVGTVLVLGGSDARDWQGKYASVERYDPAAGSFRTVADLHAPRFKLADAVMLLGSGDVFVAGGHRQLETFDVRQGTFAVAGTLDAAYFYAVATRLRDGRVLITGGYDEHIQPTDQAWTFGL